MLKVGGVALLAAGAAMILAALVIVQPLHDQAATAVVYCLVAIFLGIVVRVLQAERHHRAATMPKQRVPSARNRDVQEELELERIAR